MRCKFLPASTCAWILIRSAPASALCQPCMLSYAPRLQERQGSESNPVQGSDTVDWLATGLCFIFPAVSGCRRAAGSGLTVMVLCGSCQQCFESEVLL